MSRYATTRRLRAFTLILTAVFLLAWAGEAQAQYKSNRRWLYAAIGAVVVGGVSYAVSGGVEGGGGCSNQACVAALSAVMAGGVGYLIGRDIDKKNERRYAAGRSLDYRFQNYPLGMVPDRMAAFPGGAAIVGLDGARIVMRDGATSIRGAGLRGIEDVAVLPASSLLVLSTASALVAFPMRDQEAQGEVFDERGGGAMEKVDDRLAVAGRDSLRILALRAGGVALSAETLVGRESFEYVADMAHSSFSGVTWVLTDDVLTAYDGDLRRVGELILPASGRTVRADGGRLVVAAGASGAFVIEATDPAAPRVVTQYSGVRFAYAADIQGERIFVAAGGEGVAVVDIGGGEPRAEGVAREVRFASDVVVAGESEIWILDREGRQVQIAGFASANEGRDASTGTY